MRSRSPSRLRSNENGKRPSDNLFVAAALAPCGLFFPAHGRPFDMVSRIVENRCTDDLQRSAHPYNKNASWTEKSRCFRVELRRRSDCCLLLRAQRRCIHRGIEAGRAEILHITFGTVSSRTAHVGGRGWHFTLLQRGIAGHPISQKSTAS